MLRFSRIYCIYESFVWLMVSRSTSNSQYVLGNPEVDDFVQIYDNLKRRTGAKL